MNSASALCLLHFHRPGLVGTVPARLSVVPRVRLNPTAQHDTTRAPRPLRARKPVPIGATSDPPCRAKDSWTDRERRNLTCTDIALGAKRKSRGGGGRSRGWKTKAGGSKVFVEAGSGVVASGRAAYRKTKRGGGGGGGVRKKRRG